MPSELTLFSRSNLFAWCVVPFDAMRRTSRDRAKMLKELGFRRFAFDGSLENVESFEEEIDALQENGIELFAWWAGRRYPEAIEIFKCIERQSIKPQIWITGGGKSVASAWEQRERIEVELDRIRPFVETSERLGLQVGLYNHGGWFGEPENQMALMQRLHREGFSNLGFVYSLHHGHAHLPRFSEILDQLKSKLLAINLNGMLFRGDLQGMKILPIGEGTNDLLLLDTIQKSGWKGPLGILHHAHGDAKIRLAENLEGLQKLVDRLEGSQTVEKIKNPKNENPR